MKFSIHVSVDTLIDKNGHEITHTPTIERLIQEWMHDQAGSVIEILDGNQEVAASICFSDDATVMRKD